MKPKVSMVGRLTRPVTNVFKNPDGSAERALFTLACNSYYNGTGADGNKVKKESVDYVPCICWGGLVPVMTTWGLKGRQIQIEGTLEIFQAGPDNNGKKPPTKIQVKVNELQFLDKKPENVQAPAAPASNTGTGTPAAGTDAIDMNKLSELVAAKLLGATNTNTAQAATENNNIDEANAAAEAAANAQASAGEDLSSMV